MIVTTLLKQKNPQPRPRPFCLWKIGPFPIEFPNIPQRTKTSFALNNISLPTRFSRRSTEFVHEKTSELFVIFARVVQAPWTTKLFETYLTKQVPAKFGAQPFRGLKSHLHFVREHQQDNMFEQQHNMLQNEIVNVAPFVQQQQQQLQHQQHNMAQNPVICRHVDSKGTAQTMNFRVSLQSTMVM